MATALGVAMDRRQQMAAAAERYRRMAPDRKEPQRRQKGRVDPGGRLTEVITNNPKDRADSIEEYLADRRVADAIGASLR